MKIQKQVKIMHYLRNKKNQLSLEKQENKTRFVDNTLNVKSFPNATIVPFQGCFDDQKAFIDGTWLHEITSFEYKQTDSHNFAHIKKAVYLGCFVNIWGHCITDGLKRLWYFYSNYFSPQEDLMFVYTKVNTLSLPDNFITILNYLLPEKIVLQEIKETTIVDELYIPDVSFFSSEIDGKLYSKEFLFTLNLLKQTYTKPQNFEPYDKIYLSRTALKSHIEFGEQNIEKLFESAGFKIIHPQNYTLEQQLFLYQNCNYFASLEGSSAHNSFFCKPGTNVYILRKSDFINAYQLAVDKINETKTIYIDCNYSIMNSKRKPWAGPYFLYPNKQLCLCMEQNFNLHVKPHFPFLLFIKYICASLYDKALNLLRDIYHLFRRK